MSRSAPLLILASCFAAGIGFGHLTTPPLAAAALAAILLAIVAFIFRSSPAATIMVAMAFVAGGAAIYSAERLAIKPDRIRLMYEAGSFASGEPVELEGKLSGVPEPAAEGRFLTVSTNRMSYRGKMHSASGNVRIFLTDSKNGVETPRLVHGSRIIAACNLERDDKFLNPGVIRVPDVLDQMGIDAVCNIKSPLLIEHIGDESVFLPLAWVYDQRSRLIETFTSRLSPTAAGIMTASLLGDKHFLDRETAETFREGGTFHVLVISGLHITFIGGILLLVIRGFTGSRWIQFTATTTILWAYTLAVGADVPVVRAALMFTIVLLSFALYRPGNMLSGLGASVIVLLVWRPSDLFNPSFHLTFVSVAGIIAAAYPLIDGLRRIGTWVPDRNEPFPPAAPPFLRRMCETIYWRPDVWIVEAKRNLWRARIFKDPFFDGRLKGPIQKAFQFVFEGIIVSTTVQICMLPLLVIYFHRVPVVSIVLNLWVGIFIALESLVVVAGALIDRVSETIAGPFFVIAEAVNWLLLSLPRLLTGHQWSGIRLPSYTGTGGAVYLLYFATLVFLLWRLSRWRPMASIKVSPVTAIAAGCFVILLLTTIFHPFSSPRPDGRLTVDFLDVGQGDAALVTFPDGQTLLVDGGGRMRYRNSREDEDEPFEPDIRRIGESVVSEYLWHRGYSSIDHLLATHADADHIQGLTDVGRNFKIRSAFIGLPDANDQDLEEFRAALARQGIAPIALVEGDSMEIGGVSVQVIHPPASDVRPMPENDRSVVVRLIFGELTFLLTGDIEAEAEREILASGLSVAADVIKVPHHGSRTSSTDQMVRSVSARIAVIPVGRRSPFGHPHAEVVERWRNIGAQVLTTGERGMITISTDGRDLRTETFLR